MKRNIILVLVSVLILSCLFVFARTTTTDLGLVKPTWDEESPEYDILVDLNANSDILEAFVNDPLEFDTGERLEDRVGAMLGGTETLITVTYDDAGNAINFIVNNDLSLYSNATSAFITNTELAAFTGSANIVTLGTIGTGIWQGTAIADTYIPNNITIDLATLATTATTANAGDAAVNFFGTGVSAVTDATTCTDIEGTYLSITTGTLNVSGLQPLDTALTNISALTYVSPSFIKLTADDTYAVRTLAQTLTDVGASALQGVSAIGAVTFVDATHILSVATITYWFGGATYTTASPTTCDIDSYETLTDNTLYYFYFDDALGTLKCSDTAWNFYTQVHVATVWWNGTNGAIQKEWHNHTRNIAWHEWAHETVGTRYGAGLSLTAPTTADDATLTIASGSVQDEDLLITVAQQSTCRIVYKASASIYTWVNSSLPYAGASADPKWLDTDNYTLTSVGDSDFVCMWVYATSDTGRPIYIIPTHAADAYNVIALARAETAPVLADLNLNPEMKLIFRFIYKGDGQFQESNDYRLTSPLPSGGSASTTASAVSFSPSGNIAATTVQTALEEVDTEKAKIGANSDITSMTGLTTPLGAAYGGTGVANAAAETITIGGAGEYGVTLTLTNTTDVTLPTTGTLATTAQLHTQNTDTDLDATFEATFGKHTDKLSAFAATTSAELAGVISDETGTGALVFANSPNINLYNALASDHTYSGLTDSQPVGESVVFGQLLYYDWTDVEWKLAKADVFGTAKATRIALETKANGETCLMLVKGYIRDDSAFDFGAARIFLNDDTAGTCDDTAPAESGDQIFVVGEAKSADILFFNPGQDVGEI